MCHEVELFRFADGKAWQYLGAKLSQYDEDAAARALAIASGEVDL